MSQPQRRIFWWAAGGLVAALLFGNQGFRQLASDWRETRRLEKALVNLRDDHEKLTRELFWIQTDPSYTEYLIRKNLGYVKKGEVEYRLVKPEKNGTGGSHKNSPENPGGAP